MLWKVFGVLLLVWFIGNITSFTFGGLIHILLVGAVAIYLVQMMQPLRSTP